jgi:hypothetical protein
MKYLKILLLSFLTIGCSNTSDENSIDEGPEIELPDEIVNDCSAWAAIDYVIETQEDLNKFAVLFPNCKTFYGNIIFKEIVNLNTMPLSNIEYIEGSLIFDRVSYGTYDLSGLNNLKSVRVNFEFRSTFLKSISTTFRNLEFVGGNFKIYQNVQLESITEFDNLNTIGGNFEIRDNHSLRTLGDFPELIEVNGNLNFERNDDLTSIGEFDALTTINGEFRMGLNDNNTLTEFSGFNNLTSVKEMILSGMTAVNISGFNNIEVINGSLSFGGILEVSGFQSLNQIEVDLGISWTLFEDLRILNQLQSIGGDLDIVSNDYLTSLNGLEQLTSIGGNFKIYGNDALLNIEGSNNITSLGGAINIERNFSLKTISGFNNIQSIKELLISQTGGVNSLTGFNSLTHVDDNLQFANTTTPGIVIDAFHSLETIGKGLFIMWSYDIVTFEGFTNLTSVGEDFHFDGSSELTNLGNFLNLTSVGGTLAINNHASLENLDAFINVHTDVKNLFIEKNQVINDISGIQNINSVSEYIHIIDNPMLTDCSISTICQHLNNGLNNYIGDNGLGCNSESDVISNCD